MLAERASIINVKLHSTVGRLPEKKTHQSWPPILHESTVDNTICTETKKNIEKGTDRQTN